MGRPHTRYLALLSALVLTSLCSCSVGRLQADGRAAGAGPRPPEPAAPAAPPRIFSFLARSAVGRAILTATVMTAECLTLYLPGPVARGLEAGGRLLTFVGRRRRLARDQRGLQRSGMSYDRYMTKNGKQRRRPRHLPRNVDKYEWLSVSFRERHGLGVEAELHEGNSEGIDDVSEEERNGLAEIEDNDLTSKGCKSSYNKRIYSAPPKRGIELGFDTRIFLGKSRNRGGDDDDSDFLSDLEEEECDEYNEEEEDDGESRWMEDGSSEQKRTGRVGKDHSLDIFSYEESDDDADSLDFVDDEEEEEEEEEAPAEEWGEEEDDFTDINAVTFQEEQKFGGGHKSSLKEKDRMRPSRPLRSLLDDDETSELMHKLRGQKKK